MPYHLTIAKANQTFLAFFSYFRFEKNIPLQTKARVGQNRPFRHECLKVSKNQNIERFGEKISESSDLG